MRYTIESKSDKADEQVRELLDNKDVEAISIYEPLEQISARVQKLGVALRELKNSNISWRVFNYYLRGLGISQGMIDSVLKGVEGFFADMGLDNE